MLAQAAAARAPPSWAKVRTGGLRSAGRAQGLADHVRFVGTSRRVRRLPWGVCWSFPRVPSCCPIVLEAAAAGIPLVTTKVGGIPEIFGSQSSELVPPSDPAALARAIDFACATPRTNAPRRHACRNRAAAKVFGRHDHGGRSRCLWRGLGGPKNRAITHNHFFPFSLSRQLDCARSLARLQAAARRIPFSGLSPIAIFDTVRRSPPSRRPPPAG